ncbi:unnamed protein product [Rangifer tarandus platyrhynchus]|uniref:Uncharacterized protein n=1 Tax=Rangifer tarandus platyrhynchus TaxID=3082113 RepID=A0AC59YSI1_RANTA
MKVTIWKEQSTWSSQERVAKGETSDRERIVIPEAVQVVPCKYAPACRTMYSPRKLPEDIRRPEKQPIVFEGRLPETRLAARREKARHTRGECAQASGCLSCPPRREKARRIRGEYAQAPGCLNRSPRKEKARRTRGECAQASGCLNRSGRGRHKTQAQPNLRFCGVPENWNRPQRRARSI